MSIRNRILFFSIIISILIVSMPKEFKGLDARESRGGIFRTDEDIPAIKTRASSGDNDEIMVRVLLLKASSDVSISAEGGIKLSPLEPKNGNINLVNKQVFSIKDDKIILKENQDKNGDKGWKDLLIIPASPEKPLNLNGKKYRGSIRILVKNKQLWVINLVPLEQYLYGVVPEELGTNYIEANKAQAVVARTFALGRLGKQGKNDYDFTSGAEFQVYGGFDAEKPLCNKAVDETKGQVLLYNGKLAKYPVYHSTCGGSTSDNETVFLTKPIPYLRTTACDISTDVARPEFNGEQRPAPVEEEETFIPHPFDRKEPDFKSGAVKIEKKAPSWSSNQNRANNAQEGTKRYHGNPGDVALDNVPPANCSISAYYRWEVSWTNDELSKIVDKAFIEDDTGTIRDIVIEKRGGGGRVSVLKIITDKGEFRVRGDEIRPTFQFKSPAGGYKNLYSTRFNIEKREDNGKITWIFKGSGWGHGVGMCQFGALTLAKKGFNYQQILKKYYHGITVGDYHGIIEGTNPASNK